MLSNNEYPKNWKEIADHIKRAANWRCELCGVEHGAVPNVLTVHHVDFNPANNQPENLVALCQRCHLKAQGLKTVPLNKIKLLERMKGQLNQLPLW